MYFDNSAIYFKLSDNPDSLNRLQFLSILTTVHVMQQDT